MNTSLPTMIATCLLVWATSTHALAGEPRLNITDSDGRETSNIAVSGLSVDLPDRNDGMFIDRKGLPLEVEDSYSICIPFNYIKSGQKNPKGIFVVELLPSCGGGTIEGKLTPQNAALEGKFDIAGITGDFKLTVGKIAGLKWMNQPPESTIPSKVAADAHVTLKNGTKLDVWNLQRYEIHYVSSQYINVSSYYSDSKKGDIVLVRGESEVKIPFKKIRQIMFAEKKVTVTLTDGTSLDFDRLSSEKYSQTDAFVAESRLGSVCVEPKSIQQITFDPKVRSKDE